MKTLFKIVVGIILLLVLMFACTAAVGGGDDAEVDDGALPQGTTTSAAPVAPAPAKTTAAPEPTAEVSTCDAAREAILTGTKADIEKAFAALVADKGATATAREYARYYLGRDKGDPQMQEMDLGLIQTACLVNS